MSVEDTYFNLKRNANGEKRIVPYVLEYADKYNKRGGAQVVVRMPLHFDTNTDAENIALMETMEKLAQQEMNSLLRKTGEL